MASIKEMRLGGGSGGAAFALLAFSFFGEDDGDLFLVAPFAAFVCLLDEAALVEEDATCMEIR